MLIIIYIQWPLATVRLVINVRKSESRSITTILVTNEVESFVHLPVGNGYIGNFFFQRLMNNIKPVTWNTRGKACTVGLGLVLRSAAKIARVQIGESWI